MLLRDLLSFLRSLIVLSPLTACALAKPALFPPALVRAAAAAPAPAELDPALVPVAADSAAAMELDPALPTLDVSMVRPGGTLLLVPLGDRRPPPRASLAVAAAMVAAMASSSSSTQFAGVGGTGPSAATPSGGVDLRECPPPSSWACCCCRFAPPAASCGGVRLTLCDLLWLGGGPGGGGGIAIIMPPPPDAASHRTWLADRDRALVGVASSAPVLTARREPGGTTAAAELVVCCCSPVAPDDDDDDTSTTTLDRAGDASWCDGRTGIWMLGRVGRMADPTMCCWGCGDASGGVLIPGDAESGCCCWCCSFLRPSDGRPNRRSLEAPRPPPGGGGKTGLAGSGDGRCGWAWCWPLWLWWLPWWLMLLLLLLWCCGAGTRVADVFAGGVSKAVLRGRWLRGGEYGGGGSVAVGGGDLSLVKPVIPFAPPIPAKEIAKEITKTISPLIQTQSTNASSAVFYSHIQPRTHTSHPAQPIQPNLQPSSPQFTHLAHRPGNASTPSQAGPWRG